MILLVSLFILSILGISLVLGLKVRELHTGSRTVPQSLHDYGEELMHRVEREVRSGLGRLNKEAFRGLLRWAWKTGARVLRRVIGYLENIQHRATRTEKKLRGKNNSSSYLSEVIAHKNENRHDKRGK